MHSAPGANAPLHGPTNAVSKLRVAAQHLLEYRYRPYSGRSLKQGNDLGIKDMGQWIWSPAFPRFCLLRWETWILLDPESCRAADRSLCGSNGDGMILT
ncbi:hypothetical protein JL39_09605 [Rhizobium sp. YS-1r]|nr:hypothetical protein JL39_09605 [Rhizobium sp. YS-1r]